MSLRKCKAVLLRRTYFGNTSLVVTFLSPTHGLIAAVAKGCRRPKNPIGGRLDYFARGELVYYHKTSGALHIVSQFEPDAERIGIRKDVIGYAAASFMVELAGVVSVPEHPAEDVFAVLDAGLTHLDHGGEGIHAAAVFGLACLAAAGFAPSLEVCVGCGCNLSSGAEYIAGERGGVVCKNCLGIAEERSITPPVWQALRYFNRSNFNEALRLNLRNNDARESLAVILELAQAQVGRRLKGGNFLLHLLDNEWKGRVA